jgi:hypothetical protein
MKEPEIFPNTPEGNFDALWHIIDTRYCYLDYKNINWDSIGNVYRAKLPYVQHDRFALFDLFGAMLAELRDGHVNLYSSFDISRYDKWYTDSASNYYPAIIRNHYVENAYFRIAGGFRYAKLKNHNIGYVYYGSFSNGFSDANMSNILQYFSDCAGLIIDVRDNGGGMITNAERLASYFFTEETVTGFMKYKNGAGHSDFSRPVAVRTPVHSTINWQRPVAVLTNRYSYSATNDFVVRMRHAPNAFTAGSWTGGGGGMPLSSELPNGWMVRFSASPMLDSEMNHTEWGIAPDFHVIISEEDRENNIDSVIERAIEILEARR